MIEDKSAKSLRPNEQHAAEIARINVRRGHGRHVRWIARSGETGDALADHAPGVIFDHVGLALSGGGIRSAAFCLGAIQALEADGKLPAIDYLSTVSGGGYVGCSLAAAVGATGTFPFATQAPADPRDRGSINDVQDNLGVRHIRDYSNYLMPRGLADLTLSIGVVLRGLAASASIVAWPMLILAAVALWTRSLYDVLERVAFGSQDGQSTYAPFVASAVAAILFAAFLLLWGLRRSLDERGGGAPNEFGSNWPFAARWLLRLVIAVAVVEAQVIVIRSLVNASLDQQGVIRHLAGGVISEIGSISAFLAPAAGVIAFFAGRLADIVKSKAADPSMSALAARLTSKALLLFAAVVIPLLLWVLWIYLVFWGIASDDATGAGGAAHLAAWTSWLWGAPHQRAAFLYFVAGLALLLLTSLLEPNANSLHRLYRDRLSAAFLFALVRAPQPTDEAAGKATAQAKRASDAFFVDKIEPCDRRRLSQLDTDRAPYLIVNAALNIQGSEYANQRARNADFFVFSRDYVGSHATGFVRTDALEARHPALDLGTAMAISGAAVSSNMGSQSIRALAPTLALLNVRLGYWLPNPALMEAPIQRESRVAIDKAPSWRRRIPASLYLIAEMFSLLDETSPQVYLTDGGHIENLGVYELLKRRSRFIVVVDAECDPNYTFPSFVALQRYARIDLGVRIDDLPWRFIRQRSLAYGRDVAESGRTGAVLTTTTGPHAAVARIDYPDAPPGALLYVKSSLTGDENDLVVGYKRDWSAFPHETTGDQFFGEAQFEAYRALGYHAMCHLLNGDDCVPGLIESEADGSPLSGQAESEARELRKAAIDRLFNDRVATGDGLAG